MLIVGEGRSFRTANNGTEVIIDCGDDQPVGLVTLTFKNPAEAHKWYSGVFVAVSVTRITDDQFKDLVPDVPQSDGPAPKEIITWALEHGQEFLDYARRLQAAAELMKVCQYDKAIEVLEHGLPKPS